MHFSSDLFIEMSSKIVETGISKILKLAGEMEGVCPQTHWFGKSVLDAFFLCVHLHNLTLRPWSYINVLSAG